MLTSNDRVRLKKISRLIYRASRKIKILRFLSWSSTVRYTFFRKKSEQLPSVVYPKFDSAEVFQDIKRARSMLGDTRFDTWLQNKTVDVENGARLLESVGTKKFFATSSKIYGKPRKMLRDGKTTPLKLSKQFSSLLRTEDHWNQAPNKKTIAQEKIRNMIQLRCNDVFGKEGPKVIMVDGISAKATASSRFIKLRKGASFYEKDIDQLFNHEALVHVATTLNGRKQDMVKILGANYGSITKTQEGLAVFSELITGCMDVRRLNRILYRVLAIQMAIDGADFIDLYRFFLERCRLKTDAFENARRVFRGGVLSGGYPFTKDVVYLDGMVRVHNFFRTAIALGRKDAMELLFIGKIDLDDIPILLSLKKEGMIQKPKFVPYWIKDMNFLASFFALTTFVGDMDHRRASAYYESLMKV